MTDTEKSHFLAGFDLAGKRLPNGKLKAYLGESTMKDWPEEVELCGHTYTLENIIKGKEGYESAIYV